MRTVMLLAAAAVLAGCGPPKAQWASTSPAALPTTGAPESPDAVALSFARFAWMEVTGDAREFPVLVSAPGGNPPLGTSAVLGELRSGSFSVDPGEMPAVYCSWGPGDCGTADGERIGREIVGRALTELRERAGAAGANAVRDVRCFAQSKFRPERAELWCEGQAIRHAADGPARPITGPLQFKAGPEPAPALWSLGASASAGVYGESFVLGTTLHMRRGPIELAFHMVSPPNQKAAVLGLELLGRTQIGAGANVVYGVAGMLLSPLGPGGAADNGGTEGVVMPVFGVGKLFDITFFGGYAKPFVDLRSGWVFSSGDGQANGHTLDGLSLELVIGLTTP